MHNYTTYIKVIKASNGSMDSSRVFEEREKEKRYKETKIEEKRKNDTDAEI